MLSPGQPISVQERLRESAADGGGGDRYSHGDQVKPDKVPCRQGSSWQETVFWPGDNSEWHWQLTWNFLFGPKNPEGVATAWDPEALAP